MPANDLCPLRDPRHCGAATGAGFNDGGRSVALGSESGKRGTSEVWLCGVDFRRRSAEVALLGQSDEVSEMAELRALIHDCTNLFGYSRRAVACALS